MFTTLQSIVVLFLILNVDDNLIISFALPESLLDVVKL